MVLSFSAWKRDFAKSTYTPDLTQSGEKKKSYLKTISLQQKGLQVKAGAPCQKPFHFAAGACSPHSTSRKGSELKTGLLGWSSTRS